MGVKIRRLEPSPALPQPRARRVPRRHRRGRPRPGHGADGRELRRHRQRRLPRHLPGHRRHVLRGPGRQPDVQERRGPRFEDVTTSSGTGHLQKGHGVSFADWDGDGDLDLFVELGGATPGDQVVQRPVPQPGHGPALAQGQAGRHQDQPRRARREDPRRSRSRDGRTRSIYRTIGNNSSFGGNSLVETIGLLDATRVADARRSPGRRAGRPRPSTTSPPTRRSRSPRARRLSRSSASRPRRPRSHPRAMGIRPVEPTADPLREGPPRVVRTEVAVLNHRLFEVFIGGGIVDQGFACDSFVRSIQSRTPSPWRRAPDLAIVMHETTSE